MLYDHDRERRAKAESKRRDQDLQRDGLHTKVHTIEKSKVIIEERKIQHFSTIFRKLDSDNDGTISSQRIDLSQIEGELLGVLQLIFSEMEDTGHTLTEDEFIDACYRLYDAIPPPSRKLLFNPQANNSKISRNYNSMQNLHKPTLDSNSVKIAA